MENIECEEGEPGGDGRQRAESRKGRRAASAVAPPRHAAAGPHGSAGKERLWQHRKSGRLLPRGSPNA